jgi:integrase
VVLEKADLRQVRVHDLRHSYATHLLQAGAPITYVSEQLGHADASITLRFYAHYLPDDCSVTSTGSTSRCRSSRTHPRRIRRHLQ